MNRSLVGYLLDLAGLYDLWKIPVRSGVHILVPGATRVRLEQYCDAAKD